MGAWEIRKREWMKKRLAKWEKCGTEFNTSGGKAMAGDLF